MSIGRLLTGTDRLGEDIDIEKFDFWQEKSIDIYIGKDFAYRTLLLERCDKCQLEDDWLVQGRRIKRRQPAKRSRKSRLGDISGDEAVIQLNTTVE